MSDPAEIDRRVKGTEYWMLIDTKAPHQRTGVLGSLSMTADSFRLLPDKEDVTAKWTATRWAETRHGWVFITSQPTMREALRPLISLWIDLLVLRLLNEPMPQQKPVWFVIDELATLQRLPQLHTAITENRKSQNPLVQHRLAHEYKNDDGKTVTSMEHRAGWDATFSAPKSVSLTVLVGRDYRIRQAHRECVRVALGELERYVHARIGGNHPPEATGKFIVAKFEHDTARPVNGYAAPQLHTHAVIFNVTERGNGETRALQERGLFQSQQFATAIYQSELTYCLRQLGYEIERGRSGAPEIKGYSQEYLDAPSPRSQQIREHLDKIGHSSKEAAEIAAYSTRDRKEILSPREVLEAIAD